MEAVVAGLIILATLAAIAWISYDCGRDRGYNEGISSLHPRVRCGRCGRIAEIGKIDKRDGPQ